jgi:regulatory protein
MPQRNARRPRPPLNSSTLDELALSYVGRFSTTRSKLAFYLARKLRERGWDGDRPADVEGVVERLAGLGYVDDSAYAVAKSRSLTARGYGVRRVGAALRAAGIDESDSAEARELATAEAVESALRFARKRRIGPFSEMDMDRDMISAFPGRLSNFLPEAILTIYWRRGSKAVKSVSRHW